MKVIEEYGLVDVPASWHVVYHSFRARYGQ
jgi:hypothetical protein